LIIQEVLPPLFGPAGFRRKITYVPYSSREQPGIGSDKETIGREFIDWDRT
jgi:hypothetical protein